MQVQNHSIPPQPINSITMRSVESGRTLSDKDLSAGCLGNAVRKWEFEVFGEELLNVGALHIFGLLEFDNLEDLIRLLVGSTRVSKLNLREWNGNVSDVWRPCLGREPQLHLFLTSHGTPCTCCGCRSGNRIGSRYRSS